MSTKAAMLVAADVFSANQTARAIAETKIAAGSWRRDARGELVDQCTGQPLSTLLDLVALDHDVWPPLTSEQSAELRARADAADMDERAGEPGPLGESPGTDPPDCDCCDEFDAEYSRRAHIWRVPVAREASGD